MDAPNVNHAADCSRQLQLVGLWARYGSLGPRRTAQGAMALGAQLLLLKSATPHGEWRDQVNRLGLHASTASRYMAAARRFFHLPDAFLEAVGTASNLFELLPLTDDQVNALARGEEVAGVALDKLAAFSVRAIREAGDASQVSASISVEEERMLRLFRKCEASGKAALIQSAKAMQKT